MSDADAEEVSAVNSAVEAQQQQPSTSGPPQRDNSYDPALLIWVKGKAKKPAKPDDAERNLQVSKLQGEINRYSERIKEIKVLIDEKRAGSKDVGAAGRDIRQRLSGFRSERGAILKQKQAIREQLNSVVGKREALRAELRTIRDKTRLVNPEDLEQKIGEAEFKLSHESLSEQEEKRLQASLQQLLSARPLAKQYGALDARLKESELERAAIVKRLQDCDVVLAGVQTHLDADQAALDEVTSKAQEQEIDIPALNVEKKESYDIMVILREKINEIRKHWDERYNEYIKLDRAYNAYQREQKQQKAVERQKEREARQEEYKQNTGEGASDFKREPYEGEIFTAEQLLIYLRSFNAVKEGSAAVEEKVVEAPKGMTAFKRKDDNADDKDLLSGIAKKKPVLKKGQAAPEVKAAPAEKKDRVVKLNHTLELLKTFLALGVEVPNTTAEIPGTIEKVNAKIQSYLELRKKAKEAPPPRAAHTANGHAASPNSTAADTTADDDEAAAPEDEAGGISSAVATAVAGAFKSASAAVGAALAAVNGHANKAAAAGSTEEDEEEQDVEEQAVPEVSDQAKAEVEVSTEEPPAAPADTAAVDDTTSTQTATTAAEDEESEAEEGQAGESATTAEAPEAVDDAPAPSLPAPDAPETRASAPVAAEEDEEVSAPVPVAAPSKLATSSGVQLGLRVNEAGGGVSISLKVA